MTFHAQGGRSTRPTRPGRAWFLAPGTLLVLATSAALAGKVETWKHDSASSFNKGKKERVVISDSGKIRLARQLQPTETLEARRVWDLARSGKEKDVVYAATGDDGKVFRREGNQPWSVAYDATDTQALALAVTSDGKVFTGTGPSGQVVDLTDPNHPTSRPDKAVQYIWDLAADGSGNLYAATGPTGQLWKRSAQGTWSLLLDSKHAHLLSVAVAADGSVYAGSDGEGLIYRVSRDGKTSVVYDAPQSEIRALLVAPDGSVYAGTATEAGGGPGGGPGRSLAGLSGGEGPPPAPGRPPFSTAQVPGPGPGPGPGGGAAKKDEPKAPSPPAGGSAAPRPATPGDNAVYRIDADGVAREVFRSRVLIYALAWSDDRLLVGTGPEGVLYEVREGGRESAPIARLDQGQILALLADPAAKGDVLIGSGDPGAVSRLTGRYAASGTWTSDVLDAKFASKFGALGWRADTPAGTSIGVQVRTGNVGEPDDTWSAWGPSQSDPASAVSAVPTGRFAQLRLALNTTDPAATPELRSVILRYQTANLPPEIGRIDVPDLSEGDGAAKQGKLNLRWDVTDPNGDDLNYTLEIRKDGWPDWVKIGGEEPLTEKTYAWDTTAVPAGVYRLRITASDRPSNDPNEALRRDRTSEPFIVDHDAPTVTVEPKAGRGATVRLKDDLTRLVKASYSLDGGDWVPVFPDDGLFDTPRETITINLPGLKGGTHVLTVRATDAAGNTGAGDAVFKGP